MVEPILQAKSLRKTYHGGRGQTPHVAVDDLSFDLPPGGSLAIVGESGAGKTTTASMLMGFEPMTSGEILINGQPQHPVSRPRDRRRRAREMQIVFQDPYSSLDPRQRGVAAVEEVLAFHFQLDRSRRRERAYELLDKVGVSERAARAFPNALSGGQLQRVAIARALAAEPSILILDESVAALDVSIQAQVLNLLTDLRRERGTAYIVISHDLGVVRYATEQVIVMRHGSVVETGATSAVLDHPSHDYTHRLKESVPRPGWSPRRFLAEQAG
jgi:ABC-type glutathione transport system ATPase component